MLRVFNNTARYVDQGGGKRKGSIAVYLEPWHAVILEFLELKKNQGNEMERARDLFYALWIPDLFMKRVEENATWSLFCANEAPGFVDVWGEEFERLYLSYENSKRSRKVLPAQRLWLAIITSFPGRNRNSLYALQRRIQQKIERSKFGNDKIFQSLHKDH